MTFPAAGDLSVSGTARFVRQLTMTQIPVTFWIGVIYISDERYSQPTTSMPGSFNELAMVFWTLSEVSEGQAVLCNVAQYPFGVSAVDVVPADDLELIAPMVGKLFESVGLHAHADFLKQLPELYAHIWDIDADEELLPSRK